MKFRPLLRSVLHATVCLTAAVLLGACSVLPSPEPVDVYRLPALSPMSASAASPLPWSLRITRPASQGETAGSRIVVVPDDNRISVYKGVRWNATAPVLLRNRLVDAFLADGRLGAVSTDERVVQADFELDTGLQAFQSEYRNGTPEIVIRLDARLVSTETHRIVASRRFEVSQAVGGAEVPDVVRAFGRATDAVARELVDWTTQHGQVAARRP